MWILAVRRLSRKLPYFGGLFAFVANASGADRYARRATHEVDEQVYPLGRGGCLDLGHECCEGPVEDLDPVAGVELWNGRHVGWCEARAQCRDQTFWDNGGRLSERHELGDAARAIDGPDTARGVVWLHKDIPGEGWRVAGHEFCSTAFRA